jgi:tetratricopeptide (TPR) repeat protein
MTTQSFQVDMNEDALEKIRSALWEADDKDYWQTGMLLEKGAALGDFMCKYKLAIWLESIDPKRSIELFEELLTTPGLRFDDNSSIHFHLGKLYISRYDWIVAYKHFSDAYGMGDAKIAMGVLKHFGLVGKPDTEKALECFEEAARRYHYSEKDLREICDRFSSEFKKQQEQAELIKMQSVEIESQRIKIEKLERQLKSTRAV